MAIRGISQATGLGRPPEKPRNRPEPGSCPPEYPDRIIATIARTVLGSPVDTGELRIPKLRKGSHFPSVLEPRRMAEKALTAGPIEQATPVGALCLDQIVIVTPCIR
jgi:hypothetical protein